MRQTMPATRGSIQRRMRSLTLEHAVKRTHNEGNYDIRRNVNAP